MKMTVYALRPDEAELFRAYGAKYNIELVTTPRRLRPENTALAAGSEAVSIVATCHLDAQLARALREQGVKYVLTRTAGYDHIERAAVEESGLRCASVPVYSQNAVSEHTVLLLLAMVRGLKRQLFDVDRHVFSLPQSHARELGSMTVGIFGTGFIGSQTARMLSGFGCRLLAYARHPDPRLEGVVSYVPMDELFARSDALIFHCALNDSTRRLVNRDTIARMKDGICLVNTARGEIMDFADVLAALKSGKVGALATDVFTDEHTFIRRASVESLDPVLAELITMDNFLFTPHVAFFTDTAVDNLIKLTFRNLLDFASTGSCPNELFLRA